MVWCGQKCSHVSFKCAILPLCVGAQPCKSLLATMIGQTVLTDQFCLILVSLLLANKQLSKKVI